MSLTIQLHRTLCFLCIVNGFCRIEERVKRTTSTAIDASVPAEQKFSDRLIQPLNATPLHKLRQVSGATAGADPRSPTLGVKRTPLKFPIVRQYRTAAELVDPRSPSMNVPRTPLGRIFASSALHASDATVDEPLSAPTTPIARMTIFGTPQHTAHASAVASPITPTAIGRRTPISASRDSIDAAPHSFLRRNMRRASLSPAGSASAVVARSHVLQHPRNRLLCCRLASVVPRRKRTQRCRRLQRPQSGCWLW